MGSKDQAIKGQKVEICEDQKSATYCNKQFKKGKCNKAKVQNQCMMTCNACTSELDALKEMMESLQERQNNLCNKVKEITSVARANVASGLINANIVPTGGITGSIAVAVNTVLNGNRDFI